MGSRSWLCTLAVALGVTVAGCDAGIESRHAARSKESPSPPIVLDKPLDEQLEWRLTGIYSQLDGLDQVRVRVRNGVAHLTGTTPLFTLERQATNLAERLEGIVFVDNEIMQQGDLVQRFAPTARRLRNLGRTALDIVPQLIGAVVIFVPFLVLSMLMRRWQRPLHRLGVRQLTGNLARTALRGVALLVGVLLAFEVLGLLPRVGAVFGTLGLLALIASLAFRDWVQNYLPGVMLGLHPPFVAGDLVQIGAREGRVVSITPRATILITTDGEELQIPNVTLFRDPLINFSHHRQRRLHFTLSLSPKADFRAAHDAGREALLELQGVMRDPPPFMRTRSLGRDAVEVEFFAWVDQDRVNFRSVESRARRAVFEALAARGLPLPEEALSLRFEPADTKRSGDAAEDRDTTFLDEQVGRARRTRGERDLLDEGKRTSSQPADTANPAPRG